MKKVNFCYINLYLFFIDFSLFFLQFTGYFYISGMNFAVGSEVDLF